MKADVKFTTTVEEAALIIEAVRHFRQVQLWNLKAIHATNEERITAQQKFLRCETILRNMGADVPKPVQQVAFSDLKAGDKIVNPGTGQFEQVEYCTPCPDEGREEDQPWPHGEETCVLYSAVNSAVAEHWRPSDLVERIV